MQPQHEQDRLTQLMHSRLQEGSLPTSRRTAISLTRKHPFDDIFFSKFPEPYIALLPSPYHLRAALSEIATLCQVSCSQKSRMQELLIRKSCELIFTEMEGFELNRRISS